MTVSDTSIFYLALIAIFFLFGSLVLTGFNSTILFLGKFQTKEFFKKKNYRPFYFYLLLRKFFKKNEWESLYTAISITKLISRASCVITSMILASVLLNYHGLWLKYALNLVCLILIFIFVDFIARLLASMYPRTTFPFYTGFSSVFLIIFFPITAPLIKILNIFIHKGHKKESDKPKGFIAKSKVIEMLKDFGLSKMLELPDQKIIAAFITFREKVAREIMIPRINLCCLKAETSIRDAAKIFVEEGYSRIPIFQENLDTILGVLMYKDITKAFSDSDQNNDTDLLNMPISELVKPVIYAPENKKISFLFKEFISKQCHIAIIVDEYGGTEGIITIEDILEELVGEIEDEYDIEEEDEFLKMPNGSWVINAKMSIIDLENKLNITIPPHPEYETIGGYIFHRVGTIPAKGWKIHTDEYEIEILTSNERCIEKLRITIL
jgi:CBS domain containing-hemolysin-like protein